MGYGSRSQACDLPQDKLPKRVRVFVNQSRGRFPSGTKPLRAANDGVSAPREHPAAQSSCMFPRYDPDYLGHSVIIHFLWHDRSPNQ